MADALTVNVQDAPAAAPAVYTVPGSADVELLSAFARFDGSGAAGSFRPALTFYSDAGLILARVFPGDTVTAGDTADVTFAPFLDSGSGGSSASSSIGLSARVTSPELDPMTIPSLTPTDIEYTDITDNNIGMSTMDNIIFSVPGIGAHPLWYFTCSFRIASVATLVASNWQIDIQSSVTGAVQRFISGTRTVGTSYRMDAQGPLFGVAGANLFEVSLQHDNPADVVIGDRTFIISYLGQFQ